MECFITLVHTLAEHCEFGVLREELKRDRRVLTLEKAITRMRQSAVVKKQQPVIRGTEQATGQVEVIYKKTSRGRKGGKEENDTRSSGCGRCGNPKKHLWKDCPARDAQCRKCHKKGHFAKTHAGQAAVSMTLHSCSREVMSRRVLLFRRNVLKRSQ